MSDELTLDSRPHSPGPAQFSVCGAAWY